MLTEIEKAWMAGFVDGEGSLTIIKQVRKDRPSSAYRAYATISNTNAGVLKIFCKEYGGRIYSYRDVREWDAKWKDSYYWICPIVTTRKFLSDILPHLKLKRKQAELLLEFINKKHAFRRKERKGQHGSAPLSEEEISFREKLRLKVRSLNTKSVYSRNLPRDN